MSARAAAEALRGQGARVIVSEIDPICALQAAMDGYQVTTLEAALAEADIFVTGTGNENVITVDHLLGMKHLAIVANVGHFDNEIDMAGLETLPGAEKVEIKPQVHEWRLPSSHRGQRARAQRGSTDEPRQRDRAPVVRDEQLVRQPGARADRAVGEQR